MAKNTHCPDCGKKYRDPQPKDFICEDCAFMKALNAIADAGNKEIILLSPKEKRHTCKTSRQGDWVIYTCDECDYELWDNLRTGETKVKNSKANIRHSGSYVSPAFISAYENRN